MLKMSRSRYPYLFISSWILFLSCSMVSAFADAASPCHFISFRPFLSLNRANQPLLSFSQSSWGIPTKSANAFHFWRRTSPVTKIPSPIAFETHRYIISETLGCSVCHTRLAVQLALWFACSHCSRILALSFTHFEILGCLI